MTQKIETRYERNNRLQGLFSAKAQQIAAALGASYRAPHDNPEFAGRSAWIYLPEGIALYLNLDGYSGDGRIGVSLKYNTDLLGSTISQRDFDYNGESPDITVAFNKSPEKIAAEITRRFLPAARLVWAKVEKCLASRNEYALSTRDTANRVADALRVEAPDRDKAAARSDVTFYSDNPLLHRVRVCGRTVSFEVSGDADDVLDVIKLIVAKKV